MQRRIGLTACLHGCALLLCSLQADAFQIERAEPQFIEGEYRFELTALLDAPIDAVEGVLRDYENYPTLDSRILDAKVLERPEERTAILATTLRACFGPVCRTVKRIERVEESSRALVAIADPARSQVKLGETRMQLSDTEEGKTRVTYITRLRPDFWIPALVARRMMLQILEDATVQLFRSVEQQAQDHVAESSNEIRDSAPGFGIRDSRFGQKRLGRRDRQLPLR